MAVWLPVLKATLPYLTQIVAAAIPAFTSKTATGKPDEVLPRQIAELQTAVTHNAESVKALAIQLKSALEGIDAGIDAGAARLQHDLTRLRRLAHAAIAVSGVAIVIATWALYQR